VQKRIFRIFYKNIIFLPFLSYDALRICFLTHLVPISTKPVEDKTHRQDKTYRGKLTFGTTPFERTIPIDGTKPVGRYNLSARHNLSADKTSW
jgi:hypothetical protein